MKQNNNNNNNKNSVSVKSPDSFQGNHVIKKERKTNLKPYTMSRIKTRNYLLNISYAGVTKEDFYNRSFVFDIYVLLTKI